MAGGTDRSVPPDPASSPIQSGSAGEARSDGALRAAAERQRKPPRARAARRRELHPRDDRVAPEPVPARMHLDRIAAAGAADRLDLLAIDEERHRRDAPATHARLERLLDATARTTQRGTPRP